MPCRCRMHIQLHIGAWGLKRGDKANDTIIRPWSALATPNLQKFFSDKKKKWVRYGLANPRIAVVLVIPKHNAPFRPGAHWLLISQPRNRKIRKSGYRFVFIVILYVNILVDIGHLPSLTLGSMIVRINAVQRIE